VAQLDASDQVVQSRIALICQRCVHYAGKVALEFFRARREPSPGAWIDLHGYYATAEEWGIDKTSVREPLNEDSTNQSPAEAYAAVLLVDLASPYSHSAHDLALIMRWARKLAPFASLQPLSAPLADRSFGIDLMHDASTRPLELLAAADSVRFFNTSQLCPKIQELTARLKARESPIILGLGEDCPSATALRLLLKLYKPWCLNSMPRRFQRRGSSGIAQMCMGFESIHYHVSGGEFTQPEHVRLYSRDDMDRIWTFRDQVDPALLGIRASRIQIDFPLERWSVADQSVSGFRLRRGEAGARIEHGQLIGLKPPDGDQFLLAQVSWNLMQQDDLLAGVSVMPGMPEGIAVRPTGIKVSPSQQYVRAFLLSAVPTLKEDASLILPRGWYQPERVIEAFTDRPMQLRLGELLSQGPDFERTSFTRL
jgi:hypothetical protein